MIPRLHSAELFFAVTVMLGVGCDSRSDRPALDEERNVEQGVQTSSELNPDSFRLAVESVDDGYAFAFEIGVPEGKLMGLNIGELKDQSPNFPFREHPGVSLKRFSITVTPQILTSVSSESRHLELFFKFSPADTTSNAWWRPKFEVEKGKDASEVFHVVAESKICRIGEAVPLCSVVGSGGETNTVFVHVFDEPDKLSDGQAK